LIERRVQVVNKLGLHARAAAKLVQAASVHSAKIFLEKDGQEVNGKSIMGVMMLAASQGTELTLRADGEDEEQAMETLVQLIAARFGEPE